MVKQVMKGHTYACVPKPGCLVVTQYQKRARKGRLFLYSNLYNYFYKNEYSHACLYLAWPAPRATGGYEARYNRYNMVLRIA